MKRLERNLMLAWEFLKTKKLYAIGIFLVLTVYIASRGNQITSHVYHSEGGRDFKEGRVLGNDSVYEAKEKLFAKTVKELMTSQESLKDIAAKLQARVDELEKTKGETKDIKAVENNAQPSTPPDPIKLNEPAERLEAQGVSNHATHTSSKPKGPSVISFPVKETSEALEGIVLPSGSYVKAKLMTGIEAPEGRTYPVLLQLDFAYIVPNKKKLDLSGCFMIAKSQGDLSTERVQMQASKISCVSKEGKMFERDVNGFVADDKDNSFAVMGSVTSKQDRVAAVAFLSSIVEGVGKALQQAQTTQNTNPLGGSSSTFTGNQMVNLGAGGVANAASLVTQWYLQQAQNLLPTINVGSGQDVWVVMAETVKLPNDYFKKNSKGGNSVYTYFSRLTD